jgi:lipid-A-disaccharide synthase
MKYYIIAGEASGDLHASNLMKELVKLDSDAVFRCWGGDLMAAEGGILVRHYRDLAFMGFFEVLVHLRTILGNIRFCKEDILAFQPDVVILVDYPGFNLRIARFARESGIRVYYYISPQLWAWRSSRVHAIKKYVDRMFVILPFEKEFYAAFGYKVDFIGHPLLDVINEDLILTGREEFIRRNNLPEKPYIALLPGSRNQEISLMLETMMKVAPLFGSYHFVIAGAPSVSAEFYSSITHGLPVSFVTGQTYELLHHSEAALVTSGTATLETALMNTPQVVCYKGNPLSYMVAKRVVHIKFISLVNLVMDKEVIKELIQEQFTVSNIAEELNRILSGSRRKEILESYQLLREKLGGRGASEKAARLMIQYMKKK